MKKTLNLCWVACLLFWATLSQSALAQLGMYSIALDGNDAPTFLGILAEKRNDKLGVDEKNGLFSYLWKLTSVRKDGKNYFYLSTDANGEESVLTVSEFTTATGNGFAFTFSMAPKLDVKNPKAGYQMWLLDSSANKEVQDGRELNFISNALHPSILCLSYKDGILNLTDSVVLGSSPMQRIVDNNIWKLTVEED